jgi:hypothetical protein
MSLNIFLWTPVHFEPLKYSTEQYTSRSYCPLFGWCRDPTRDRFVTIWFTYHLAPQSPDPMHRAGLCHAWSCRFIYIYIYISFSLNLNCVEPYCCTFSSGFVTITRWCPNPCLIHLSHPFKLSPCKKIIELDSAFLYFPWFSTRHCLI